MIDRKSEKIDGSIEVLSSFHITAATASGSAGTEYPKMKDIQYHYMRLPTHTT